MRKIGPWTQKSSKVVYKNKWISVREDQIIHPNGKDGMYGIVETNPAVFLVVINDQNEILLNKQFRYTTEINSWEIPAGSTDGNDRTDSAKKELQEETGYMADQIVEIGKFQTANGFCSEFGHIFLIQELSKTEEDKMDEEGINDSRFFSINQIKKMILEGEITDAQSISSIFQALLYLNLL